MKYIVIPARDLSIVPQEALDDLNLSPRYSTDRTEVLMKIGNYEKLFPQPMTLELIEGEQEEITYPYPTFDSPSEEFDNLLSSLAWTSQEEQV